MLRKITGKAINSHIHIFYCKTCKKPVDYIYKDYKGNSYCEDCKPVTTNNK